MVFSDCKLRNLRPITEESSSMYLTHIPGILQRKMSEYLWRVPTEEKTVFLTFDDGPTPEITSWVLDQLAEYHALATFFMVGEQVKKHPEIAHKVIDAGHEIGNHTRTHVNGKKTSTYSYLREFAACQQILKEYTGTTPSLFRPPYGRITKAQATPILNRGIEIVMMDIITGDFDLKKNGRQVAEAALTHTEKGSVLLFHDSVKAWPRLKTALPVVLESLANEGFSFRKIEQEDPEIEF